MEDRRRPTVREAILDIKDFENIVKHLNSVSL